MKKIKGRVAFKFKKEVFIKNLNCITKIKDALLGVQGVKVININLATGFRDNKNKMIYEHDIIRIHGYHTNGDEKESEVLFLVQYLEDYALFVLSPFQRGDFHAPLIGIEEFSHSFETFNKTQFNIIGNVYKSQKLLGLNLKGLKKCSII